MIKLMLLLGGRGGGGGGEKLYILGQTFGKKLQIFGWFVLEFNKLKALITNQ